MANYLYYDLSGGLNYESSKSNAGLNPKKLIWSESYNVELYKNTAIKSMKGNQSVFQSAESIVSLVSYALSGYNCLIYNTTQGNLYLFNLDTNVNLLIKTQVSPLHQLSIVEYCGGVILSDSVSDPFYFKIDADFVVAPCNAKRFNNNIRGAAIAVYKGRLFIANGSTLYYSALGKFDDWETEKDAGFISDFYNDTSQITALKPYKGYLAIYKQHSVYLLSGSSYEDFAITPFADKGACSQSAVVTVENSQYFVDRGVYSLEQVGELNQIRLSQEFSKPVHSKFSELNESNVSKILAVPYNQKFQVWFFLPSQYDGYINNVLVFDYNHNAWFRRIIPQKITGACVCGEFIYTADNQGKIYIEDFGYTFDGQKLDFYWESPFFSFGEPNMQKTIDEFYLTLDSSYDNNFRILVKDDYNSKEINSIDEIKDTDSETLVWNAHDWSTESDFRLWASQIDSSLMSNISGYHRSVQICIDSEVEASSLCLLGFEFKDVLVEN